MASQKDMWADIAEVLRDNGYLVVKIDDETKAEATKRPAFATMVARRGRPPKAAAAKVTRIHARGRHTGTLTPEQVREIRECYRPRTERVTAASLAQKYGVSIPTVRLIISGRDAAKHKLTGEDLIAIREAYKPAKTYSAVELAGRFGVTPSTILAVAQGKTHRDVSVAASALNS